MWADRLASAAPLGRRSWGIRNRRTGKEEGELVASLAESTREVVIVGEQPGGLGSGDRIGLSEEMIRHRLPQWGTDSIQLSYGRFGTGANLRGLDAQEDRDLPVILSPAEEELEQGPAFVAQCHGLSLCH